MATSVGRQTWQTLARAAALEAGIPELWDRLKGNTPEELLADARELAYRRDHPPDAREAAEQMAATKAQLAANKAEIARCEARIAEITARRRKEREWLDARRAEIDARITALRVAIRERLATRPGLGSGPRARETRPRRTRARGSRTSRGDPSRSDDDDPEPVAPGGRR